MAVAAQLLADPAALAAGFERDAGAGPVGEVLLEAVAGGVAAEAVIDVAVGVEDTDGGEAVAEIEADESIESKVQILLPQPSDRAAGPISAARDRDYRDTRSGRPAWTCGSVRTPRSIASNPIRYPSEIKARLVDPDAVIRAICAVGQRRTSPDGGRLARLYQSVCCQVFDQSLLF